ncbi:MAG: ABC-type transporter, integral rane subunit, partial [Nocardioides sp.]|nr:ABC-type transporter, integral rane subunit [Nocardioides sp.]
PWAPVYPAILIMLTVGALNLLADIIREATPDAVRRTWRRNLAAAGPGLVGGAVALDRPTVADPTLPAELKEDEDARVPAA